MHPSTSYETKFSDSENLRVFENRMHSDDETDKGDDVYLPKSSRTCTCGTRLKQLNHQSLCWRIMQLFYPYYLIGLLYKLCSQLLVQLSYLRLELCSQLLVQLSCLRLEFNWVVLLEIFFQSDKHTHTLVHLHSRINMTLYVC